MIALVVFTHGRRECLRRTIESARFMLDGPIAYRIMVDDSCDPTFAAHLDATYPEFHRIHNARREGFAGAIKVGWAAIPEPFEWVLHIEDDFTFERRVDIAAMIETLAADPKLVQLALKRQPWNEREKERGSIYLPGFEQHEAPHPHVRHRSWWTTNPSLYHRRLTEGGWPQVDRSEGVFTHRLLADVDVRFGYWGRLDDGPWVTHIGDDRAGGKGY